MKATTKDNATGLPKRRIKLLTEIQEARLTGKTAAEIADALDLSVKTVYNYFSACNVLVAAGKPPGEKGVWMDAPVERAIGQSKLPVPTAINTDPTHPLWFPGFDGSMPPSLNQIMLYASYLQSPVNAKAFYERFTESAWCNLRGEKLTDWRVMFKHWHNGHPVVKEQKEQYEREKVREWKKYAVAQTEKEEEVPVIIEQPKQEPVQIEMPIGHTTVKEPSKVLVAPTGMLSFAEFHPAHKTTRLSPAHYGTSQIPWKKVAEQAIDDYNVLLDYYLALLRQS